MNLLLFINLHEHVLLQLEPVRYFQLFRVVFINLSHLFSACCISDNVVDCTDNESFHLCLIHNIFLFCMLVITTVGLFVVVVHAARVINDSC